jgi:hypothetical protein
MAFRNRFIWSVTGYDTQAAAEKELEEQLVWFKQNFDHKNWTLSSGVAQTTFGFRASIEAEKTN